MAAPRGLEQDEMRLRIVFSPGSASVAQRPFGGTADVNPATSRGRRFGRLAALAALGLMWPALSFAQAWSAQPKPPAAAGPSHPYRPTYGRWSPGQVLPPTAGAVAVTDYERFHLRRPPRGYAWMLCDGDFILTNAAGLIFEVIPSGGG